MKAMIVHSDRSLHWEEVPTPKPKDGELLIEIHYAALNRADLMQRAGDYPPPPGCPEWMGLEISGIVREMGKTAAEKSGFRIGDRVCALLGGGGYAEYVTVDYGMAVPVPEGRSMAEAAAMPEAFCTAYLNLFLEGKARAGDTLLMQAGASGLASVVIPMAKAFGLRVLTTVRGKDLAERIRPLGADRVIDTERESLCDVLRREAEDGHPVDVAIDCLGGDGMGACLPYLAHGARWIMLAALAGTRTEIDLKTVYVRNIRIIGSTLRSRTPDFKAELLGMLKKNVWPMVEEGKIPASVYRIFEITEAEEAHALMASGKHNGKIVLHVKGPAE